MPAPKMPKKSRMKCWWMSSTQEFKITSTLCSWCQRPETISGTTEECTLDLLTIQLLFGSCHGPLKPWLRLLTTQSSNSNSTNKPERTSQFTSGTHIQRSFNWQTRCTSNSRDCIMWHRRTTLNLSRVTVSYSTIKGQKSEDKLKSSAEVSANSIRLSPTQMICKRTWPCSKMNLAKSQRIAKNSWSRSIRRLENLMTRKTNLLKEEHKSTRRKWKCRLWKPMPKPILRRPNPHFKLLNKVLQTWQKTSFLSSNLTVRHQAVLMSSSMPSWSF